MGKHKKSASNIYIKTKGGERHLLFRIVTLAKNGTLFAYKFVYSDLNAVLARDTFLDGISGRNNRGKSNYIFGDIVEVTYHLDGNVTYKDARTGFNLSPRIRQPRLDHIKKTTLFLKMIGIPLDYAARVRPTNGVDLELELAEYSASDVANIDLYISSSKHGVQITPGPHSQFPDRHVLHIQDEEWPIDLHVFLYRYTGQPIAACIGIHKNDFRSKLWRIWYQIRTGRGSLVLKDYLYQLIYKLQNIWRRIVQKG